MKFLSALFLALVGILGMTRPSATRDERSCRGCDIGIMYYTAGYGSPGTLVTWGYVFNWSNLGWCLMQSEPFLCYEGHPCDFNGMAVTYTAAPGKIVKITRPDGTWEWTSPGGTGVWVCNMGGAGVQPCGSLPINMRFIVEEQGSEDPPDEYMFMVCMKCEEVQSPF